MKKSFILIALITVLAAGLFISCNVDGSEGLYASIESSIAPSGIEIMDFLGYDSGTETYHFLSKDNMIYTSKNKNTTPFAKAKGYHITGATLYGDYYYFITSTLDSTATDGKVYKVKTDGSSNPEEVTGILSGNWRGLSGNGYLRKDDKAIYLKNSTPVEINASISYPYFSGDSMLIMSSSTTATIYYRGNVKYTVSGFDSDKRAVGLVEVNNGEEYVVFYNSKAYRVNGNVTLSDSNKIADSLDSPPDKSDGYVGTQYSSNGIIFKSNSRLYLINYNATGKEDYTNSFSSLKSAQIITMTCPNLDSKVLVVTLGIGIRVANISTRELSDDLI